MQNRLKRDVYRGVEQLITVLDANKAGYNAAQKPFTWAAKACNIREKVQPTSAARHEALSV